MKNLIICFTFAAILFGAAILYFPPENTQGTNAFAVISIAAGAYILLIFYSTETSALSRLASERQQALLMHQLQHDNYNIHGIGMLLQYYKKERKDTASIEHFKTSAANYLANKYNLHTTLFNFWSDLSSGEEWINGNRELSEIFSRAINQGVRDTYKKLFGNELQETLDTKDLKRVNQLLSWAETFPVFNTFLDFKEQLVELQKIKAKSE